MEPFIYFCFIFWGAWTNMLLPKYFAFQSASTLRPVFSILSIAVITFLTATWVLRRWFCYITRLHYHVSILENVGVVAMKPRLVMTLNIGPLLLKYLEITNDSTWS